MAQVIVGYHAEMSNRGYIYDSPDYSSGKTQYEAGTSLYLPADYGQRETNGFYPVDSPGGWIEYYILTGITPDYDTAADKCKAPTSVTLSGNTLTIKGGAGGDLNTFTGYGISWRDKPIGGSYGSWSSDTVVSTTNTTATYTVSAPAGKVREFRARTIGSAGASYYSDYVVCATTLTGNTSPSAPSIVRPAANASTYSTTPVVILNVTADADGDSLTLKRRIDSGSWTTVKTLKSGSVYDKLPTLGTGSHTVNYQLADSYASSSEVSVTFTVQSHSWKRTISTGTIISNSSISHVADINELLAVVNKQRAFYGLGAISLPGTVGKFSDWKSQMEKLVSGVNEALSAAGQSTISVSVPSWPTASVINSIRTASKAV